MSLNLDYEGLCVGFGRIGAEGRVVIKGSNESWSLCTNSARNLAIDILLQVDRIENNLIKGDEGEERQEDYDG